MRTKVHFWIQMGKQRDQKSKRFKTFFILVRFVYTAVWPSLFYTHTPRTKSHLNSCNLHSHHLWSHFRVSQSHIHVHVPIYSCYIISISIFSFSLFLYKSRKNGLNEPANILQGLFLPLQKLKLVSWSLLFFTSSVVVSLFKRDYIQREKKKISLKQKSRKRNHLSFRIRTKRDEEGDFII